jgi:hypothetical protein
MGSPLALLGLLAVAVPIIIHLLGRYQQRVEKFPTLQFIGYSRQTPTSRKRISDWPLLLVRIAIVSAAVLALTQPSCSSRPADDSNGVTRVVIVDTSASMRRVTPSGPVASVMARQVADRESMGVADSRRVETESPASTLPGVVAWLENRPGLREVVIVSDFQRGTLDSTDLASIPQSMGLTLAPIATTPVVIPGAPVILSEAKDLLVSTFAGPSDVTGADAAWRAVGRPRPTDTTGRIAIIYRGAQAPRAVPIDSPWMARIVTSLQRDRMLNEAAPPVILSEAKDLLSGPDTIARNRSGKPVITGGRNGPRLQFAIADDAGSLVSAAFNAALLRAVEPTTPGAESDSISWTAEDIARWQRPATPHAGNSRKAPDGRWFWLACLALIGLETYVRSRRPEARTA